RPAAKEKLKMRTHQEPPRPKRDRRHLLQPAWGCDVTIARFAPEPRSAAQRLKAPRASALNRWPDLPQTDNALLRRAPGSAHRSFPNRDQVSVRASAVSVPAFLPPAELPRAHCRPKTVDGQRVVRRESRPDCIYRPPE